MASLQYPSGIQKKREVLIARDRVGIRPLFYTETGGGLAWASEIKSLFAGNIVEPEIDPAGVAEVFTYWVNIPPTTSFKNVKEKGS
jgi:asparagine synthase (glutamine-hydrolysing)